MPSVSRRSQGDGARVILRSGVFGRLILPLIMLAFLESALPGRAQDTATIVGTVTDASGSVVPGAKVSVANPDRGFVRDVLSNSAGDYEAGRIPIGNYVITAEISGFEKLQRSGISVSAGQTQRVDLTLTVGQLAQQVSVSGNVTKVETESATLSDVVTSKQIQNLTLNGLNFGALTFLVPGAVQDNGYSEAQQLGHAGAEVGVSFNGNREEYSNLELDGGNNSQESSTSMGGAVTPAIDMIAEFRISTSNYGADVGQHAGALVEIATKGGTKQFHGDGYEFVRNNALDANDWFANQQIAPPGGNAPKTPLKWNIFGYTFGGPFYIPHVYNSDKSKTFFFWSQEWARYRQASVVSGNVPTEQMRGGDFSQCAPGTGNPVNTLLISQGCVLPSVNGVPVTSVPVNPNAAAWLNGFVPLPDNGVDGYISAHSVPTNFSQESIRVDQNINDKTSLFVRFTNDEWAKTVVPALWSGSSYDTTESTYEVPARQTVLHLNNNIRPNLLNEFIFSYTDTPHFIAVEAGPGSIAHSVDKPSSWNASTFFPANAANPQLPSVSVGGGTPFGFTVNNGNYRGPYDAEPVYTYRDNVAWNKGDHTFKFGFFLEKFQLTEQFGFPTQGWYTFSNSNKAFSTGNALADMFMGRIAQYQEGTFNANGVYTGGYGVGHWRRTDFEPYFQDDWKVSHKLTLNFGVRYYLLIAPHDVTKPTVDSSFIPSLYNPAAQAVPGPDGLLHPNPATGQIYDFTNFGNGLVECGAGPIAKGCQSTYFKNVGPRFGFAFDPTGSGKTSIRGGIGIYFEAGNGNDANTIGLEGNAPTTLSPSAFNLTSYNFNTTGGFAGVGPTGLQAIPYYQKNPAITQMNVDVQHEFSGNNLVTVAYVGTLGRHLDSGRNLDQVPVGVGTMNVPALSSGNGGPCDAAGNCNVQQILMAGQEPVSYFVPYQGYTSIREKQFSAVSSYNALQTELRHTTGWGLTAQVAYTWSHMIDDSTSSYFATGVDDNYDMNRWKGTSDLNRAQVFSANYIYALPFFRHSGGLARSLLGGWDVSGITSFFTGVPVDFGCGVAGYSTGIGTGVRCDTAGPVKIQKSTVDVPQFGPMVQWVNPAVFQQPLQSQLLANGQPGMFGYMGRNMLTGPGRNNWDLALHKEFELPWFQEHSTLQFRLETFNTFNHPQWNYINIGCNGSPNSDGSSAFGRTCGGNDFNPGNGTVSSAWSPRNIQLGMKFLF